MNRYIDSPIRGCLAPVSVALLTVLMTACSPGASTMSPQAQSQTTANTPSPTPGTGRQGQGASGTLTKIDGNTLYLTTAHGQVTVKIGSDARIQKTVAGTMSDLQEGQFLTVTGSPDANGTVGAASVTIWSQAPTALATPRGGATPGSGGRPAQPGSGPAQGPVGGRSGRGVSGTLVRKVSNTLTLSTDQGQVSANVASYTSILKIVTGAVADLQEGESLVVLGNRDADGNIVASSISIRGDRTP